jgi:hypothetical protein
MNGKSPRLVLKVPRYFIFSMFMTVLLALFVTPGAMAGCKNGKGKCKTPPNPTPATQGSSVAFFDAEANMHVEHSGELGCSTGVDLTVASGDYFCNDPLPDFHISTASFTGLFNKKYREICGSLGNTPEAGDHNFATLTPYEFSYGWRDDCTNGSCRIEISMKFKGSQISTETKNKADQLSIVISGWAEETPVDDANPFYLEDVIIDVDSATLEFGLTGKRRSVGLCPFGVDKKDKIQSVTFHSLDP